MQPHCGRVCCACVFASGVEAVCGWRLIAAAHKQLSCRSVIALVHHTCGVEGAWPAPNAQRETRCVPGLEPASSHWNSVNGEGHSARVAGPTACLQCVLARDAAPGGCGYPCRCQGCRRQVPGLLPAWSSIWPTASKANSCCCTAAGSRRCAPARLRGGGGGTAAGGTFSGPAADRGAGCSRAHQARATGTRATPPARSPRHQHPAV